MDCHPLQKELVKFHVFLLEIPPDFPIGAKKNPLPPTVSTNVA